MGEPTAVERGSVLMLMPAAVLVFIVLGALAVDSAVAFLAERELSNAAAAAANDAAGAALDRDRYYRDGDLALVPSDAEAVVAASLAARGLDYLYDVRAHTTVGDGGAVVTVRVTARVDTIFSRAVPGGPESRVVSATAVATTEEGG